MASGVLCSRKRLSFSGYASVSASKNIKNL